MTLARAQLAAMVDHTLLAPEATDADVARLAAEAARLDIAAACVSASRVAAAAAELDRSPVAVAAVVGFPSGAHRPQVKADEAARAIQDGATELDMVIDLGDALAGEWTAVAADVAAVRHAGPMPIVLKVIIEAAVLDEAGVRAACATCEQEGADIVKTSTGFHPTGGATVAGVALIAGLVAPRLGVKAAGGIRTAEQALAMVAAGATRLGMSRTAQVLDELDG